MLATKAFHGTHDFSSTEPEICIVSEADDENYYGTWEDSCAVNVRFPKETTMEA